MLNGIIIITALTVAAYLTFSKRVAGSSNWKATVTPLASIMGSGFLVSAPLLANIVGVWAWFCMAVLLVLAYGVGSAIRFNIEYFEPIEYHERKLVHHISFVSRVVLAGAYFISVTYYLQLLSAFALNGLGLTQLVSANMVTSAILLFIGCIGIWRGLGELEKLESYAISLNLGMIAALLVALIIHNITLVLNGSWQLPAIDSVIDLSDLRVLLGLLIVVQGFETSRYLGKEHPADQRIKTMKAAQMISGIIYLFFIGLATVLFHKGADADVTAIIEMTAPVAAVLPILLSVAAIGSQFSAAVADNAGAGGLLEDLTEGKLPVRYAYLLILITTLMLTWETNVNTIIAYASRAFALYYMLQSMVAFILSWQTQELEGRTAKLIRFAVICFCCLLVFALGLPSE